jgi:hypothetical protein
MAWALETLSVTESIDGQDKLRLMSLLTPKLQGFDMPKKLQVRDTLEAHRETRECPKSEDSWHPRTTTGRLWQILGTPVVAPEHPSLPPPPRVRSPASSLSPSHAHLPVPPRPVE